MSTTSQPASDTQRPQPTQAQRSEEAAEAFNKSLRVVGHVVDTELQGRAKDIHGNAQALIEQEKKVEKERKKLAKEGDALQKWVDKSKKQLASFDDIGKVQEGLDDDLEDLEAMIAAMEGNNAHSIDEPRKHTRN